LVHEPWLVDQNTKQCPVVWCPVAWTCAYEATTTHGLVYYRDGLEKGTFHHRVIVCTRPGNITALVHQPRVYLFQGGPVCNIFCMPERKFRVS
jgi:hypothetical protein